MGDEGFYNLDNMMDNLQGPSNQFNNICTIKLCVKSVGQVRMVRDLYLKLRTTYIRIFMQGDTNSPSELEVRRKFETQIFFRANKYFDDLLAYRHLCCKKF